MKKFLAVLSTFLMVCSSVPLSASAYNKMAATVYANRYAQSPNNSYLYLDADCTNFVSQCVKQGGISMKGSGGTIPKATKKGAMENTTSEWYMHGPYSRAIGYKYWEYSSSWACVSDFKSYFNNKNHGTVKTYNRDDTKTWYSKLQPGDVLQAGSTGHGHSVLITKGKVGSSNPRYCGHSNDILNENCSKFVDWAKREGLSKVYVIHFS